MIWPFARRSHPQGVVETVTETGPFLPDRFAFKLFRELVRANATSNVFCSPFSVMLCLMMVWEGATGETREAMAKALEIMEDPEGCQRFLQAALAISSPGLELAVANSLWCDEQARILPAFLTLAREKYAAEVVSLPLQSPETVPRINAWVADKTRGKIGSIVDSLTPLALLVALNAIYFKGLWKTPFEKSLTREEQFFAPGNSIKVPLMRRSGYYPYHEESTFQAVRLPYQGDRVGMYIFLPSKMSGLPAFLRTLTAAEWSRWMWTFAKTEGLVGLPRFRFEHSVELVSILANLGMAEAFDPERAQFGGMALPPPPIYIGQVIHRALVEVNEEGTEAAAVTMGTLSLSAAMRSPTPRKFQMILDRPFFFAIRDDHSNMLLFMGAVNNPS